jgi:hypothetical protein
LRTVETPVSSISWTWHGAILHQVRTDDS